MSTTVYRLDMRGKGGQLSRARLLQRGSNGKFQLWVAPFTEEHVSTLRTFEKAAAAVAKAAGQAFDLDKIVGKVNSRSKKKLGPRRRRNQRKAEVAKIATRAERNDNNKEWAD